MFLGFCGGRPKVSGGETLFGAKSSPSIADFWLKRTADLESGGIMPEAVATVKRNKHRREDKYLGWSTSRIVGSGRLSFDEVVL